MSRDEFGGRIADGIVVGAVVWPSPLRRWQTDVLVTGT
jgi:hypothetical protein